MEVIEIDFDLEASAEDVWRYVEDFADIQAWWPRGGVVDIERVELEGEGIGMVRHIYNVGFTSAVSERLDYLDPASHRWQLSIVCDKPAGILEYQATGQLTALGDKSCRLSYRGEFSAEQGREDEARGFLLAAYKLMANGLESAAQAGSDASG